MKRDFSPAYVALFLVLGCVLLRLLNNAFPDVVPNFSPQMAVALVSGMVLPRAWGWLVGPVAFLLTDLVFVEVNRLTDSSMFSWWTLLSLAVYVAAGGLGLLIARRKSLGRLIGGSIACSLVFYVVANTFSWWHNPEYAANLAGWWQANTVGLPGYTPTWCFLRNAVAGDLVFVVLLVLVLDRGLVLGHAAARSAPRAA